MSKRRVTPSYTFMFSWMNWHLDRTPFCYGSAVASTQGRLCNANLTATATGTT